MFQTYVFPHSYVTDLCLSSYLLSILDLSPLTPSLMTIGHDKKTADLFEAHWTTI